MKSSKWMREYITHGYGYINQVIAKFAHVLLVNIKVIIVTFACFAIACTRFNCESFRNYSAAFEQLVFSVFNLCIFFKAKAFKLSWISDNICRSSFGLIELNQEIFFMLRKSESKKRLWWSSVTKLSIHFEFKWCQIDSHVEITSNSEDVSLIMATAQENRRHWTKPDKQDLASEIRNVQKIFKIYNMSFFYSRKRDLSETDARINQKWNFPWNHA